MIIKTSYFDDDDEDNVNENKNFDDDDNNDDDDDADHRWSNSRYCQGLVVGAAVAVSEHGEWRPLLTLTS